MTQRLRAIGLAAIGRAPARAAETTSVGEGIARISEVVRGTVGVTVGADGFVWREGGAEHRMPAPRIDAVDTLAAGDVWHGAFTLAIGERRSVADAARFANAAAALKCTRFGGRSGAPTCGEVEVFLARLT